MKNKIVLLFTILLVYFIGINSVLATNYSEIKNACSGVYENTEDNSIQGTLIFPDPKDGAPYLNIPSSEIRAALVNYSSGVADSFYNYTANSRTSGIKPIESVEKNINNGIGCPEYLAFVSDVNTTNYVVFGFSEDPKSLKDVIASYKLNKVEVKINNDTGIITVQEDVKTCKIEGDILKEKYSFEVLINNTKKNISSLGAELEIYNNFSDYNYDSSTGCIKDAYICRKSISSNFVLYNSKDSFCETSKHLYNNDKQKCLNSDIDFCESIGTSAGDVGLITEGCNPYSTFLEDYLKTKNLEAFNNLKNFCRNIIANTNYTDAPNSCFHLCLTLDDKIEAFAVIDGECGFSEKLLAWVNNILRWLKYILPIIVIVFGIIDFIKAIVADKDDEMKKAQKRFITRLIAAALVFIIPYIITFILDKMGFTVDSCGIDLFK